MQITDRIKVYGHDIRLEMNESVPMDSRENFNKDLEEEIRERIQCDELSGMVEMYYVEEISDELLQTDVDVKWTVIDYKEIAKELHDQLAIADNMIRYDDDNPRHVRVRKSIAEALKKFENANK